MLTPRNYVEPEVERFDAVSQVIQESRSWIELKQIVSLSGVSLTHCKAILAKLISCGFVGAKVKQSTHSAHPVMIYAKQSVVEAEERQRSANSAFKHAKSRFQLWPELMDGKAYRPYTASPNALVPLAMLSRQSVN